MVLALAAATSALGDEAALWVIDRQREDLLPEPGRATPGPVHSPTRRTPTTRPSQPAYQVKTLTNLDGSGFLVGDWANIRSETGNPAYSPTNTFLFDRHDDEFEQVMAYYWITEAQKYIQGLGFGTTRRPVNKESQDIRINEWGVDNSFSWDKNDMIKLGEGRRRRRRGRGGDPPRVRPRDPGLAAGSVRLRRSASRLARSARASPTTGP